MAKKRPRDDASAAGKKVSRGVKTKAPRSKAPRGLRAKIVLALVSALLAIAIPEIGARLLFPPPPPNMFPGLSPNEMEDPDLLWRNRPNSAEGPINSLGFRGPEVNLAETPGSIRILSMGESTTYGDGVSSEATYSQQLEINLRNQGVQAQVLNAGVRAWSTVQSVRFLELNAAQLMPKTVIFYHEINDLMPTTFRGLRMQAAGLTDVELMSRSWLVRISLKSRFVSTIRLWLARRQASATLREMAGSKGRDVLEARWLPFEQLPITPANAERPWMDTSNPLVRVPDADRADALRKLIELTRSRGIRLVIVHPVYLASKRHQCLLTRIAAEEKIGLLDAEDLLASDAIGAGLRKSDYFTDPLHPNARGHAVIARGLAALLTGGVNGGR
jgi:lysophospholipase L1-like esterase